MPSSMLEEDIQNISQKLVKMIKEEKTKTHEGALDLIEALEKIPVTIDVLTKTRIGMVLNDFRKKTDDEKLAKRCKSLIKRWKAMIDEKTASSHTNIKSDEMKLSDEKKVGSIAPSSSLQSKGTNGNVGMDVRSKSIEMLTNALRNGEMPDGTLDPEQLATRVEQKLFDFHKGTGDKYKASLRSRVFNLRDKKNHALRENILTGAVAAEKFAMMTTDEMASEEMKRTREEFTKESIMEHQMAVQEGTPTDMFRAIVSQSRALDRQR